MESDHLTSILFFFILVALSAYFSSSETAFTSANRIRLKNQAESGDEKAKRTLNLSEQFDAVLSTILIGNNIVNIASTAIATVLFVEWMPTYGATVSTIVTTIIILMFGEITPKLLAKLSPESFAKFSTPILFVLMTLFKPAIWFFEWWKNFLSSVFKLESGSSISEEELLSLVDEAKVEGSIEHEEHKLVRAAIEFDDVEVVSILTPRVDVVGVELNDSDEEIEDVFESNPYSRIIVFEDSVDHVVGILHEKDFHRYLRKKTSQPDKYTSIKNLLTDVLYVPPVMSLSNALRLMQKNKTHMAIVVDEHGGMIGIATMEDALEELVGEIWDETDIVKEEIETIVEGKEYSIQGTLTLEKLFSLFELKNEQNWVSNTVSGFVIEQLEHVPEIGTQFTHKGLLFTVTDIDRRRIKEIKVERIE